MSLKNLTIYAGVLLNKDEFAQECKAGNVCGPTGLRRCPRTPVSTS